MKPFRFRAAPLLDVRRRQEELARAELTRAQAVALQAAAELDFAATRSRDAATRYCAALRDGIDIATIERHRNWTAYLQTVTSARQRAHDDRRGEVDNAVRTLQLAHREVRKLERLRDRMVHRHQEAVRRADLKEMDAFAAAQFARRTYE